MPNGEAAGHKSIPILMTVAILTHYIMLVYKDGKVPSLPCSKEYRDSAYFEEGLSQQMFELMCMRHAENNNDPLHYSTNREIFIE